MKRKNIDAVKMMRDIRDSLTEKYLKDPSAEMRDLEAIRRKYKISAKAKRKVA